MIVVCERMAGGVEMSMHRDMAGGNGSLDALFRRRMDLGTLARWDNRFGKARFSDEELSIAMLCAGLCDSVEDGAAPLYSLADSLQDQRLALARDDAAKSGETVTLPDTPWNE